jgi:RNase H-fold protein (predicted Holliday junction resolvase)
MTQERSHFESRGSVLALDLGEKLVGAAISDAQQITIKRLAPIRRSNWKRLLSEVETLIERFDARSLVRFAVEAIKRRGRRKRHPAGT